MIVKKNLLFLVASMALVFFISCSSDNGEDIIDEMKFDCSQSDLSLTIDGQSDPSCSVAGSITASASGGLAPYSYAINDGAGQADGTFDNLQGGSYEVIVTDANECTSAITVTLNSDSGFTATSTVGDCGDDMIVVNTVPTGDYSYSLNGGTSQTSNTFDNLNAGTYEVVITDSDGCTVTLSNITIESGVSLSTDISPIITANCASSSCHGGSQSPNLSTSANIIASASRVKARTGAGTMPPGGSLPQTQVDLIAQWVDCGAENN